MIRLIMVPTEGAMPSESPYCNPDDTYCERSQQMIDTHYDELFSDTPRCVITLLRCFTDGCASVDGTPLIPTLFNIYGYPLLISYIMFMFFITFGLFNLITAILVENTVEAAKSEKARGLALRQAEAVRIASKLQTFMLRTHIVANQAAQGRNVQSAAGPAQRLLNELRSRCGLEITVNLQSLMNDMTEMEITPEVFHDLVWDPEIGKVLDDLDISVANRETLFDVLDADGSGVISAEELIRGLLKLRGSAEKSDVVGVLLGMRALQKEIGANLKPMIRMLGVLGEETCHRVHQLE